MPLRTAITTFATAQVVAETGIEQVIETQRIIQRQRDVALVLPVSLLPESSVDRLTRATEACFQTITTSLSPGFASVSARRRNLNVGLGRGHPLEVLQGLLDVPQVQQVAGLGRHGIPQGRPR